MKIRFMPQDLEATFERELTILQAMQQLGLSVDAPCGGHGKCGKCRVVADGETVLACQTPIKDGMMITLSETEAETEVLRFGRAQKFIVRPFKEAPYFAAVDIGTTTLACQILDGKTGKRISRAGALNPQESFGADVVSRIQAAVDGSMEQLTARIREAVAELLKKAAAEAMVPLSEIGVIGIVGNPCMQQLFFGLLPDNLARPPFPVKINRAEAVFAKYILSDFPDSLILKVPDISGYVGADTMGCILSTDMNLSEETTLLVDIGTNGEMVLGNRKKLVACATAAGPALEGAGITFGMRGAPGAIDHVSFEDGELCCHVIGGQEAQGICGSGLIDAVSFLWENGLINRRGRLQPSEGDPAFARALFEKDGQRCFALTSSVYLTQDDIRQVQMAKGAIAAGIDLMMQELDTDISDIKEVYLAGAFGSFIRKESACSIGLLPPELLERVQGIGNAAIEGCCRMVCERETFAGTEQLARDVYALDLASLPGFARCYAKHMEF